MATTIDTYKIKIQVEGNRKLSDINNSINAQTRSMTGAITKGNVYAQVLQKGIEVVVDFANEIRNSVKEFQNYENSLRLITNGQNDLNATMKMLTQEAIANRAGFGDTVDLYTKLTLATETMGKSQDEVVDVMGKFQKALALSGADANTAAGAIRQFGQAMASGQVRGDEFNSIVEALGPALNIMARESGITVGELRDMSQAGELTAEAFFKMLQNSNALEKAFAAQTKTIAQLETELNDALGRAFAKLAEDSGLRETYQDFLESASRLVREYTGDLTEQEKVQDRLAESTNAQLIAAEDSAEKTAELRKRVEEYNTQVEALIANMEYYGASEEAIAAATAKHAENISDLTTELDRVLTAERERTQVLQNQERVMAQRAILEAEQLAALRALGPAVALARTNIERYADANEKNRDELSKLKEELKLVEADYDALNNAIDSGVGFQQELQQELATTGTYMQNLKDDIQDLEDAELKRREAILGSAEWIGMIEREAAEYIEAQDIINARVRDYKRELDAGLISQEQFNARMRILGVSIEDTTKEVQTQTEWLQELKDTYTENAYQAAWAAESVEALREHLESLGYTTEEVNRIVGEFKDEWNLDKPTTAIEAFNARMSELLDSTDIELKAAADSAEVLFNGMNSALDQLVDDGKINFKSLADTMIKELAKIAAKAAATKFFDMVAGGGKSSAGSGIGAAIGSVFGPVGSVVGGIAGKIFGGLFADGGFIKPGQVGIVGEAGPEFITGPANIIPMGDAKLPGGGATSITYNINAVDAMSFKAMVAQDPEFIYNITEKGKRQTPSRRRV